MKALVTAALAALVALVPAAVQADDESAVSVPFARVGEHVTVELRVSAPADARIQVDPGDEAWADVEVLDVAVLSPEPGPEGVRHRLAVTVAMFEPGDQVIAPAVLVIGPDTVERRELPPVRVTITSILRPGDPLELSPLPLPERIGGAQSPWLVPGIIGGVALAFVVVAAFIVGATALARRWWNRRELPVEPELVPLPDVATAEALMHEDPVAGYRELARAVRSYLAAEYRFPARALTTEELQQRMQRAGVDHWVARMTRELLAECDAVVYAGYRPAAERRAGDVRVAREILGGGG